MLNVYGVCGSKILNVYGVCRSKILNVHGVCRSRKGFGSCFKGSTLVGTEKK